MLSALRSRILQSSSSPSGFQPWKSGFNRLISSSPSFSSSNESSGLLDLQEVEKILNDVKADDIKVIPVKDQCDWADFMVIATGRSTWHVRNIAEALIYQVKQKQKGSERILMPSVQGQEGGKWIVIDSGKVIIHALDEKAREYYDLESLYTKEAHAKRVPDQDLGGSFVKVRPVNNSKKKPVNKTAR